MRDADVISPLIKDYQHALQAIRQDISLLASYQFDPEVIDGNQHQRLKLMVALYNELLVQPSSLAIDYDIATWLFEEEFNWRSSDAFKSGEIQGNVDIVHFSAWILTFFNCPEVIWRFYRLKHLDADSISDFDREYLLFYGVQPTKDYIESARVNGCHLMDELAHPFDQQQMLKYIIQEKIFLVNKGESERTFAKHLNNWRALKRQQFSLYQLPINDAAEFLYQVHEKQALKMIFSNWLHSAASSLSKQKLGERLIRYGRLIEDYELSIQGAKLNYQHGSPYNEILPTNYAILAECYIDAGQCLQAMDILGKMLDLVEYDFGMAQIKRVIQYANNHAKRIQREAKTDDNKSDVVSDMDLALIEALINSNPATNIQYPLRSSDGLE